MARDFMAEILIKNGRVIDGSGAPAEEMDLLISDHRIEWLGRRGLAPASANARVIDADGRVVCPGFIDAHAHGDPFATPAFENFTAQGVTAICIGQDGESPAKGDLATWMNAVDREARPALNIISFAGHGSIRQESGVNLDKPARPEGLARMQQLAAAAMRAGCVGLSTGLEYEPGYMSDLSELAALARTIGAMDGLIMSHMRSEDDTEIDGALDELIAQGREGQCHMHVSHIKIVYGKGRERAESFLDRMNQARESGVRLTADVYPYTASCTTIGIIFPGWALPPNDYAAVVASRRLELADYLRRIVEKRGGPEATLFGTPPWAGQTLAEAAANSGKAFENFLIEDVGPHGASAAYFVMDSEVMERLWLDPHIVLSSDGSPEMGHPRGYGSFAKVLKEFVRERNMLPIESAIHKMTGLTAKTLHLQHQGVGLLQEGADANVLVFDPHRIADRATYAEPHLLAEGMDFVIINGEGVREDGAPTGLRPGRTIRKQLR